MNGAGRKSLSWTTHLGVMVGFLVLTVLFLYPASFQFTTRIVGAHNDAFENLWNFWWIHHVLTGPPTSFFVTDYLFHPHGVILHLHSLSLANAAAAAVLQGLVSLSTAYNLIAMASFALSGWAMFWLAYDRAGSVPASFLAGFVYTFSPYHLAHGLGHINLMGLQWLPLYVLFLMRTRRRSRLTEPVLAALFLILTALTSWYYFVFALVLTFLYGAWETYRTPGDVLGGWALGRWLLTLLLAAAVLLPLLVPMMAVSSSHSFYGQHVSETWSVDAASLLCPGRLTSLGRVFSTSDCWNPFPRSIEGGTYLGVTVLLLALYGSTRHEEGTFWGLVGAGALVLALGPVLHLLGRVYSVPLPFAWLERWMPFASVMAMPVRWMAVVFFALSLLVAHASVDLFSRVDELRWKRAIGAILLLLIGAEYVSVPYPSMSAEVPDFYRTIRSDPATYAVLDATHRRRRMYYATVHEKPIVGGSISRIPDYVFQTWNRNRIFRDLTFQADRLRREDRELALGILHGVNVRYVVVLRTASVKTNLLGETWDFPRVYADGEIKVFRVPGRGSGKVGSGTISSGVPEPGPTIDRTGSSRKDGSG